MTPYSYDNLDGSAAEPPVRFYKKSHSLTQEALLRQLEHIKKYSSGPLLDYKTAFTELTTAESGVGAAELEKAMRAFGESVRQKLKERADKPKPTPLEDIQL